MTTKAPTRNRELAQIHIARQQLGMDDDAYRDVLWTVARVRSAADLDWSGRKRVLDHLKACGFKVKPKKIAPAHKPLALTKEAIEAKIAERAAAKKAKNFAEADRLRPFEAHAVAERRECGGVETATAFEVADQKAGVVDHWCLGPRRIAR